MTTAHSTIGMYHLFSQIMTVGQLENFQFSIIFWGVYDVAIHNTAVNTLVEDLQHLSECSEENSEMTLRNAASWVGITQHVCELVLKTKTLKTKFVNLVKPHWSSKVVFLCFNLNLFTYNEWVFCTPLLS
jgi:hypothetical protein